MSRALVIVAISVWSGSLSAQVSPATPEAPQVWTFSKYAVSSAISGLTASGP
jgi:hypothetical protein